MDTNPVMVEMQLGKHRPDFCDYFNATESTFLMIREKENRSAFPRSNHNRLVDW